MRKVCTDLGFTQEAHLRKEYLNKDLIQYGYFTDLKLGQDDDL